MNSEIRSLFPVTERYIYMNHAAVAPLSTPVRIEMSHLLQDVCSHGVVNYSAWVDTYEKARGSAAALVKAHPHEIAFMRNTSEALATIANGIDWKEGDNVVTTRVEFPSNMYPWMRIAQENGVRLKLAEERAGTISAEELVSLIDDRTRVLALSWVQFSSGFRSDLAFIGQRCRERGVIFVVDAIQGLGGFELDVERDYVDAFAADAHKYLLGPEGIALLYVSDRIIDQIRPTVVGWTSVKDYENYLDYRLDYRQGALRFECGTLNTVGVYGLGAAIDLFLEVGPKRIQEYILDLTSYLAAKLSEKGCSVVGSRKKAEMSGIVTFTHGSQSPGTMYHRLLARRIVTAPRVGRLRISPHFYNTHEEVDTLIDALFN